MVTADYYYPDWGCPLDSITLDLSSQSGAHGNPLKGIRRLIICFHIFSSSKLYSSPPSLHWCHGRSCKFFPQVSGWVFTIVWHCLAQRWGLPCQRRRPLHHQQRGKASKFCKKWLWICYFNFGMNMKGVLINKLSSWKTFLEFQHGQVASRKAWQDHW